MGNFTKFILDYERFSVGIRSNLPVSLGDWINPFLISKPKANHYEANFFFGDYNEKGVVSEKKMFVFSREASSKRREDIIFGKTIYFLYMLEEKLGIVAIHSSSIALGNFALLFIGPSGEGKSKIVTTLDKGGQIINDDINIYHIKKQFVSPLVFKDKSARLFNKYFVPLKKVFIIEKSTENKIIPIKKEEIAKRIEKNFLFHSGNSEFNKRIMTEFIENSDIVVFRHNPFRKAEFKKTIEESIK